MIWEIEFGTKPQTQVQPDQPFNTSVDLEKIETMYVLILEEHCLECAVPQCYTTCPLYIPRKDLKCARFRYGIYPNFNFNSLYQYGADLHFRKWGKVWSPLKYGVSTPAQLKKSERIIRHLTHGIINPLAGLFSPVNKSRKINRALNRYRRSYFRSLGRKTSDSDFVFDEFVVEIWNPNKEDVVLILEIDQGAIVYRDSIRLKPGKNYKTIPFSKMNVDLALRRGGIQLFPENDAEVRLIFSFVGFVRYKKDEKLFTENKSNKDINREKAADKVKCFVWDLDNTLWEGILVEDGLEKIKLRDDSYQLIKDLDERGIIQSISSKNNEDMAMDALKFFGLDEYFIYPQINWNPKSQNIKQIAENINIGLDTLAYVDDSPNERSEVSAMLPSVRVYSDEKIPSLIKSAEFDVPITEMSKKRRLSYLAEMKRNKAFVNTTGDAITFLRECDLKAELFTPVEPNHIARCLELIQRSNQLNLSTNRYSAEEFSNLLNQPDIIAIATSCEDKFGKYGLVGFAALQIVDRKIIIKDFVQSCRVAHKYVEHAWFHYIMQNIVSAGYDHLYAEFIPTPRNGALYDVMMDIGFKEIKKSENSISIQLDDDKIINHDVVQIVGNLNWSLEKKGN